MKMQIESCFEKNFCVSASAIKSDLLNRKNILASVIQTIFTSNKKKESVKIKQTSQFSSIYSIWIEKIFIDMNHMSIISELMDKYNV